MPAETVTVPVPVFEGVHEAASVASCALPSLICASRRASSDCPEAIERPFSGWQRSVSAVGGPMVTTTGAEEMGEPALSIAVATSEMVLPETAPAFAATVKVAPRVGRDPETLEGADTLPAPDAESESCVIEAPAVLQALATTVSGPPGWRVAPAPGTAIRTSMSG